MSRGLSFVLLSLYVALFSFGAAAQQKENSLNDAAKNIKVQKSNLTGATMPKGAISIWRDGRKMPAEMNKLLVESAIKYNNVAIRGRWEIIVWTGKEIRDGSTLTQQIKRNLQTAGWEISSENQFKTYAELLLLGSRGRLMSAFILPADNAYIFVFSELVPLDGMSQSNSN